MFHIIRWPLLVLSPTFTPKASIHTSIQVILFTFIFVIFGLYVFVRQIVNAIEWMFACGCPIQDYWLTLIDYNLGRGMKGLLRKRLRAARDYNEWKDAARTMDEFLGFDQWKRVWNYKYFSESH